MRSCRSWLQRFFGPPFLRRLIYCHFPSRRVSAAISLAWKGRRPPPLFTMCICHPPTPPMGLRCPSSTPLTRAAAGWCPTCSRPEIRATQEVMAARAAQLALFILEFMTAARTPAPVFALAIARGAVLLRRGFTPWGGILFVSGHRRTFGQEPFSIKCDSATTG